MDILYVLLTVHRTSVKHRDSISVNKCRVIAASVPLQLRPSTTLQNIINIVAMDSHGRLITRVFFLGF